MRRLLLTVVLLFAGTANAEGEDICVRNFLGGDPAINVCENIGGRYIYVQPREGTANTELCAVSYPDLACTSAGSDGYRFVRTKDGGKVCVVDFNQPGIGNYCEVSPDLYAYAQPAN